LPPAAAWTPSRRGLAQKLGDTFGQTFVVDNRPGAGSLVASKSWPTRRRDGYTLMMISATTVVHPILYKSRFDIPARFTPVSQVNAQGYVLVVHPAIPAKSAAELVNYARAKSRQAGLQLIGNRQPDPHEHRTVPRSRPGTRMIHIRTREWEQPTWTCSAGAFNCRSRPSFLAAPRQVRPPARAGGDAGETGAGAA